ALRIENLEGRPFLGQRRHEVCAKRSSPCFVANLADADIGSLRRSGRHPREPEEQNTEEPDQRKPDGETRVNGGHGGPSFANRWSLKDSKSKKPAPAAPRV